MTKIALGKEHWKISWTLGTGTTLHFGNTKSSNVPSNCISGTSLVIPNTTYNIAYIEVNCFYGFSSISIISTFSDSTNTTISQGEFDRSSLNYSVYSRIFSFSKFVSVNLTTGHTNYGTQPIYLDIFLLESYNT